MYLLGREREVRERGRERSGWSKCKPKERERSAEGRLGSARLKVSPRSSLVRDRGRRVRGWLKEVPKLS